MSNNDNGVNIKKKSYHHGDLRTALIDVGMKLLASSDAHSLSLREVAREIGVSATSVYRHFPDKESLMEALARTGVAQLSKLQQEASAAAGGGQAGFAATGRAYIHFALANPALFRLIFASPALSLKNAIVADSEGMAMLRANAAAAVGKDNKGFQPDVITIRSWALVHGFAMLMLDGQIPIDDALIEAAIH